MTPSRLADALDALADARAQRAAEPANLFTAVDADPVERVHDHAPNEWRQRALDAVRAAAERFEVLTVDDVRPRLPDDVPVYDERALGAVMRRAAKAGWIASTRTYRPSTRPETHRRPLLVWRSCLRGDDR